MFVGTAPSVLAGGWYVGNTAPTEWVRYQKVYFSEGTYRFTARAGSPVSDAKMHLEIDGETVQPGIVVPNTGRADAFDFVHLGSRKVTRGYHDLKIVFDTADLSLDWFMLSKDPDPRPAVKAADITMIRPDTTGLLIAPVVAFGHMTGSTGGAASLCKNYWTDENVQPYSDAQIQAWYGIPIYTEYDRRSDFYWDNLVDELMASRAQVPLIHCRATRDFTRSLDDRDYERGPGHFSGRWLQKFAEAVARNPQASSALKVGMFWENGAIADNFKDRYGHYPTWSEPELVDYVMEYHLSPWFDNIPAEMLCQPIPGRPVISLFANHPDRLAKGGRMADFIAAVRSRLEEKYGYDPLFILPTGGDVDADVEAQGAGQCPWGVWDGPMLTPNTFKGQAWGTCCAGSRRRLDTVWLNDWDPATNKGTPAKESPGVDHFRPRIDANGNSVLLDSFAQAKAMKMRLVQQEGFTNMAEGNSIYRSYHPGWKFPNQHIAAMREYADPTTQTAIFEAEGCDDYFKVVKDGNSGGTYRAEWYGRGNDLDVYRPLHNLQDWRPRQSLESGQLVQISAGAYDLWGVDADGQLWARHLTGTPDEWKRIKNAPKLTAVTVSKDYAWGLVGSTPQMTGIPYGWPLVGTNGWKSMDGALVQISTAISKVWGVDETGTIFWRPIDGLGKWTPVSGTMDAVFATEAFVWGMQGSRIFFTRSDSVAWKSIPNPHHLITLAVGSDEVWGANAKGEVYRRSVAGVGDWDAVGGPGLPLEELSVGAGYAWGLAADGKVWNRHLEGFSGVTPLPPLINTVTSGNGEVTLTWTAVSGATGYNIKRSLTRGGPFVTIQRDILPEPAPLRYIDKVTNGAVYYYMISAITPEGETAHSKEVAALPESKPPAAPVRLAARMGAAGAIELIWVDRSSNEAGFRIERRAGEGEGKFVPVGAVGGNVTQFSDRITLSGPDYTYRVRAYNAAGASPYSNTAFVASSTRELKRAGWKVTAPTGQDKGGAALDGDLETSWTTGAPQAGGEWLQVDMGRVHTVYQIDLWNGGGDYPRSYTLEVSTDGEHWVGPVTAGTGLSDVTTLVFPPQSARYLKVTQTGQSDRNWFSIKELKVFADN